MDAIFGSFGCLRGIASSFQSHTYSATDSANRNIGEILDGRDDSLPHKRLSAVGATQKETTISAPDHPINVPIQIAPRLSVELWFLVLIAASDVPISNLCYPCHPW